MNSPFTARQVKIGALVVALAIALTAAVALAVQLGDPNGDTSAVQPGVGSVEEGRDTGAGALAGPEQQGLRATSGTTASGEALTQPASPAGFQTLATGRQEIIYTGRMRLRVDDVAASLREAERIATTAGGLVASSRVGAAPENGGFADAELTLRVPTAQFDAVLDRLSKLGTLLDRGRKSQNVTEEVIDVETRVANQQRSIARIRDLLGKAEDLQDIVALESELSRREAELESLLARQAMLKDQTQLATITVSLHGKDGAGVPKEDDRGFLVGLRNGWEAFTGTLAVLATVAGVALPFLVALALLALPVIYALRRSRLNREPTPAPSPPPAD